MLVQTFYSLVCQKRTPYTPLLVKVHGLIRIFKTGVLKL